MNKERLAIRTLTSLPRQSVRSFFAASVQRDQRRCAGAQQRSEARRFTRPQDGGGPVLEGPAAVWALPHAEDPSLLELALAIRKDNRSRRLDSAEVRAFVLGVKARIAQMPR